MRGKGSAAAAAAGIPREPARLLLQLSAWQHTRPLTEPSSAAVPTTRDGPSQPVQAPGTTYFLIFGLASTSPAASPSAPAAAAPAAPQPGPEAAAEAPSGRSCTSRSTGVVRHLLE